MARESFGNTWWGNEWLKALSNIDFENRIPRGAAYARKGAVLDLNISNGVITASVQGSQSTPYRVTIGIPQFSGDEVHRLMESLMQEPLLVSKMLNQELDPKIIVIAENLELKIFPSQWNELEMKCSCPDMAIPCKHLAAVIYTLSREIDNNPFLLFSMHGLDILAELRKRGIGESTTTGAIPQLGSMMEYADEREQKDYSRRGIDFTHLEDISQTLTSLLPERPVFCPSADFKKIYSDEIQRLKKKAQRIISGKQSLENTIKAPLPPTPLPFESVQILINGKLGSDTTLADCASLLKINDDELDDVHPSQYALYQALQCCLHLIANGAIVPHIYQMDNGYFTALWQPAVVDPATHDVIESLDTIMPPDLMVLKRKGNAKPVQLKNQTLLLTAFLLDALIMELSSKNSLNNEFYGFVFQEEDNPFDGVGEASLPASIRSWFDRLTIGDRQFCPVVMVDIDNEYFNINIGVSIDGMPVKLRDILNDSQYESVKVDVLRETAMLTPYIPGLEHYIWQNARRPMRMDSQRLVNFILQIVPTMRLLGIKVMLPKELQQLARPQITMALKKRSNEDNVGQMNLKEMLDFDWKVAMGDNQISVKEFKELASKAQGLIKFKGSYIYVNADDLARIEDTVKGLSRPTPNQLLQSALSEDYDGATVTLDGETRKMISQLSKQKKVAIPKSINATLRPYQHRGYEWLYRNSKLGFGSIIADDMGLGKTLQVITLLQRLKDDGELQGKHILIIVPTTLIANWQSELKRFAPDLSVQVYHGGGRDLKKFDSDILITTYGVARSDAAKLKKTAWQTVVIDEAQNIKNAYTEQSKAVRSIPADNYVAMSGTPIENRLSEFWTIMDFTNHGILGSESAFQKEFATPIQKWGNTEVATRFRRITAPFMLRRLKTDKNIINDLPDKTEENTYVALTEHQAALYHETVEHAMQVIEKADTSTQQALFKRQGLVLQMILALKQICNHPALFLKNGKEDAELSGKTQTLLTLLEGIVRNHQKVLIFTQFKEMGEILVSTIRKHLGQEPLFLHGACSVKRRRDMVDAFQSKPECNIFILSIKAAGTGLNLTAASHVVHYDLWWNPAVEAQATDRAFRIGQHQNVIVHRFITINTFEEQINRMIEEKRRLADITVSSGENWIGNLSNKELKEIFS